MEQQLSQNKLAARQCLLEADKLIKESRFADAKSAIEKARALDPSNYYISAFIDRIAYFEKEKKTDGKDPLHPQTPKAPQAQPAEPVPKPHQPAVAPQQSQKQQVTVQQAKQPTPVQATSASQTSVVPPAPTVQAKAEGSVGKIPASEPAKNFQQKVAPPVSPTIKQSPTVLPVQTPPTKPTVTPPEQVIPPVSSPPKAADEKKISPSQSVEEVVSPKVPPIVEKKRMEEAIPDEAQAVVSESTPSSGVQEPHREHSISETQLEEMKRKIEMLTKALEEEKRAREEMNRLQIQQAIAQFKAVLEKAWVDGAPTEQKMSELEHLASTLAISENVVRSLMREIKLEMYGRAVKEVIAKRQLLRSSSSTLEWLRKVYNVSMDEYLEYESKFLMDLVADQYKGTIFQISSDETTKKEITPKLKSLGYAVVTSPTPEDALEKIDKLNPNVIVCETSFGAGSLSGIRFLHILRTNPKFNFIPFIFLCSEEDYTLLASSELKPNEAFLKKPANVDELSALITSKLLWFREYIMSLSK